MRRSTRVSRVGRLTHYARRRSSDHAKVAEDSRGGGLKVLGEIESLRAQLADAEARACSAEEQLLRVHRAVRAVKKDARSARDTRNGILDAAKRHASELIRQAQQEANRVAEGPAEIGTTTYANWSTPDPSLDARLDEFMNNDLEPDRSRGWILGDLSA